MKLCFTLTMPNTPSANGKWSGDGELFAKVVAFVSAKDKERAAEIIKNAPYFHKWSDGWGANVGVREVSNAEAAKLKQKSKGFWGYDWMVTNIIDHGSPYKKNKVISDDVQGKMQISGDSRRN